VSTSATSTRSRSTPTCCDRSTWSSFSAAKPTIDPADDLIVHRWDTDEPSLRGIDGIERMRLIRDDITTRVAQLTHRLTNRTTP
jgi:hypothetical protein